MMPVRIVGDEAQPKHSTRSHSDQNDPLLPRLTLDATTTTALLSKLLYSSSLRI
jgi:hypothetical protein